MPIMPTTADTEIPADVAAFQARVRTVRILERLLPIARRGLTAPLCGKLARLKSESERAASGGSEYARWRHASICTSGGDQLVNGYA